MNYPNGSDIGGLKQGELKSSHEAAATSLDRPPSGGLSFSLDIYSFTVTKKMR
jgi:hypothetical protein